tara:strand:+ start:16133 stop:16594 length:462 start_codon:yes stop_codon:yes gene_type:complete
MDNKEINMSNQNDPKFVNSRFKIFIAFFAITIAVLYLILSSFNSATTSYLSVEEALNESENSKSSLGVIGKLVPDSFRRSTDGLTAYFSIKDDLSEKQLSVSYSGEIGEIFFNENAEIIIQGIIQNDGIFLTNTLSIKCPSKYVDMEDKDDYS